MLQKRSNSSIMSQLTPVPSTTFLAAKTEPTIFVTTIPGLPGVDGQSMSAITSSVVYYTPNINDPKAGINDSGINGGVVAGVAIGCLLFGAILASVLLTLLLGKRHRSTVQNMQNKWNAERQAFEANESPKALYYIPASQPPVQDTQTLKHLQEANQRIKQLEQERNAASQFGDTLDRHSEQDLLTSSTFGLYTYDQTLKQTVMAIAVKSSGTGQPGHNTAIGLTHCTPDQLAFLRNCDPAFVKANFENVLLHLINGFLYEKACAPFSTCLNVSQNDLLESLYGRLQGLYDQAVVARWRCLTQTALRTNQTRKDASKDAVLTELNELIVQVLVWTGMDDAQSAERNVKQNLNRLRNAINVLFSLLDVLHEEMSSSNYVLYMAGNSALTKRFGITAQSGRQSKVRIVTEVVTA